MLPLRIPEPLVSLVDNGIIDDVVRPLMSGKEAQVYLVIVQGEQYVAKIYKEPDDRTFRHRSQYTEGRRVRNTRDQRAMSKGSRYGRSQQEDAWRSTEIDVIYRLRDVGVRVPEPKAYLDNVLVMELVTDRNGNPAPRLADLTLPKKRAEQLFATLLREVVKMLCAGLVHGDLSEFNVLAGAEDVVIIDFPQAVDSATNRNARTLLLRDVGNLTRFFGRFSQDLPSQRYGEEMWALYEAGDLTPESELTGRYKPQNKMANVKSLLEEIDEMEREHRTRREALGLPPPKPVRHRPEPTETKPPRTDKTNKNGNVPGGRRRRRKRKPAEMSAAEALAPRASAPRQPRESPAPAQKPTDPTIRRRRPRRKPKRNTPSSQ